MNFLTQVNAQSDAERAEWGRQQTTSARIPTVSERLADSSNYGTMARFGAVAALGYWLTGRFTKNRIWRVFGAALAGLALFAGSSGCVPGNGAPRARIDRPGLFQLYQDGLAQKPATATETTTQAAATVPPGVPVTAHPDGSITWTTAAPLSVVTTRTESAATGPAAFEPPAPATPTEEAAGLASLWMRLGLVAGIAAGVFGLVKGWDFVAWGGGAIAAGCVAGMALASVPPWLWLVFGVGAAACIIGPVIWHTKLKPKVASSPAPA
jgi:hypothetical protein